jgi:integrase
MDDWGLRTARALTQRSPSEAGRPAALRDQRPGVAARAELRRRAARAGVRRRFVARELRHAHALELAHESAPLNAIQRQLGHRSLGVTSIYLQGIDTNEIIDTVHGRRQPMIPASAGLVLPVGR